MAKKTKKQKEYEQSMIREYYRANPCVFFEEEFGLKFNRWQKFIINFSIKRGKR